MTLQYSTTLRNNQLDAVEDTVGVSAKLQIFTGAQPANCAAADSGTLLVEMTLPSDWMNDAASASKTKLGTWSGLGLDTGDAEHFRIKDNGETVCHIQGSISLPGLGGNMELDNVNITPGQSVSVVVFTLNAGNG